MKKPGNPFGRRAKSTWDETGADRGPGYPQGSLPAERGSAEAEIQERMMRYLNGWFLWARAIYYARAKKHGAGRMPWRYALKMGACYRWLADGQMRGGRPPRYIRKVFQQWL